MVAAALQFLVAVGGGAWAGHAADGAGVTLVVGMLGMAATLVAAYAASGVLGLVFAPVVLAQILRVAARRRDPDAPPPEPARGDYIGIAMIAVVIVLGFVGALVVGVAVWLLADQARLLPTLLQFLAVALGMALLAPSARRVVV